MLLPIYAIGQPVLKKVAKDITPDYPALQELIANMWETMYAADGVGLAAPQVGLSIRLFLVDAKKPPEKRKEDEPDTGIKKVFINARIVEESGPEWTFEEGCLSIPDIRGDVERKKRIRIRYLDENFEEHIEDFDGVSARVIQHEYDHIEGILFTELLKPVKKQLIKRKLDKIKKGEIKVEYKMKFAKRK
ncbi:MAG: peptide deformylase [Saprospiraceae bacterium]|nr:MAG: peptide deformylase [Saprospiraceae bacterium]